MATSKPAASRPRASPAYWSKIPPSPSATRLKKWGVADYKAIFSRAIGLNAVFAEAPRPRSPHHDFIRNYYRFADTMYMLWQKTTDAMEIDCRSFEFDLYASGEYSRMLERECGKPTSNSPLIRLYWQAMALPPFPAGAASFSGLRHPRHPGEIRKQLADSNFSLPAPSGSPRRHCRRQPGHRPYRPDRPHRRRLVPRTGLEPVHLPRHGQPRSRPPPKARPTCLPTMASPKPRSAPPVILQPRRRLARQKPPTASKAFMDQNAFASDGVFLIGRVKWHTDFAGQARKRPV